MKALESWNSKDMRTSESSNGRNSKMVKIMKAFESSNGKNMRTLESSNGRELWICLKFGPVSVSDMKFRREIKTSPKMTNGSKFVFSEGKSKS